MSEKMPTHSLLGRKYARVGAADPASHPAASIGRALALSTTPLLDSDLQADLMRLSLGGVHLVFRPDAGPEMARVKAIDEDSWAERIIVVANAPGVELEATHEFRKRTRGRRTHELLEERRLADVAALETFRKLDEVERDQALFDRERVRAACAALQENNPLFLDDESARFAGLPRPLVAPMTVVLWLCERFTPRSLTLLFSNPALVDATLGVEVRGVDEVFVLENDVVFARGRMVRD